MKKIIASALVIASALALEACSTDIGEQQPAADAGTPPADSGMQQPADSGPQPVVCGDRIANCSGVCRDLTTDRNNCGGCGLTCPTGNTCVNSVCTTPVTPPPTCAAGLTSCSGTCCNLQTDQNNCGACGTRCVSGATCTAGRCVMPAPPCDTSRDTYDVVASPRLQAYCPEGIQVVVMGTGRGQDVEVVSDGRVDTGDPTIDRYFGASGQALSLSMRAGLWSGYMFGVTGYCSSTRSWLEASTINAYRGFNNAADAGFQIIIRGRNVAATNCPIPSVPMPGAATPYPWCSPPVWMACR